MDKADNSNGTSNSNDLSRKNEIALVASDGDAIFVTRDAVKLFKEYEHMWQQEEEIKLPEIGPEELGTVADFSRHYLQHPNANIPEIKLEDNYTGSSQGEPTMDANFINFFEDVPDNDLVFVKKAGEHLKFSDLINVVNYEIVKRKISPEELEEYQNTQNY